MVELDPRYLSDLASQIGSFASFLGGFSATFLVTLLTLAKPDRIARATIALAAVAAVSFIVSVGYSLSITLTLHPQAPQLSAPVDLNAVRIGISLSFALGLLALLAAIGLGGWIMSKRLGMVTSAIALAGMVVVATQLG